MLVAASERQVADHHADDDEVGNMIAYAASGLAQVQLSSSQAVRGEVESAERSVRLRCCATMTRQPSLDDVRELQA